VGNSKHASKPYSIKKYMSIIQGLKAILFFQKPCIIDMYFVVIPLNKLMGNHSQVDFYDFKSVVFLILVTI